MSTKHGNAYINTLNLIKIKVISSTIRTRQTDCEAIIATTGNPFRGKKTVGKDSLQNTP